MRHWNDGGWHQGLPCDGQTLTHATRAIGYALHRYCGLCHEPMPIDSDRCGCPAAKAYRAEWKRLHKEVRRYGT